ncbi:bifunctional diguanylate cyclase/phosphodiesterase [Marinobacter fonticola]|uniref:bifunctional diguanylate cyclase/phosphodiesterase n=1 Tax=Marinobacter fonticola TaxID=2603215 RepID=UPI0011E70B4B|nr:EAL domain-containing protein [Marinobacter fonticola]
METSSPQAVDLSNCDREPIHIPGAIQSFGALIVVRLADFQVMQASANVEALMGRSIDQVLECQLHELIGKTNFMQLEQELNANELHVLTPSTVHLSESRTPCNVFYVSQGELLIAEFEQRQEKALQSRGFWSEGEMPFMDINNCKDTGGLCRLLVREVRRLTGFDRVLAYKFDEDWHGEVTAEVKSDRYPETYLDHHFPASDIPAQARRMFTLTRLRMIPDVGYRPVPLIPTNNPLTGRPLDMTYTMLRNVSPIHLEYLENMGVAASMTISLLDNDKLWGMVTCHHASPRNVPHSIRLRCKVLGELASYTVSALEKRAASDAEQSRKISEGRIKEHLSKSSEVVEGLENASPDLLRYLQADTVIVRLGGRQTVLGQPLTEGADDVLFDVMTNQSVEKDVAQSRNLSALDARFESLAAEASGALLVRLTPGGDALLAIRREQVESRLWAGNPNKPVTQDPNARIHPRKSFDHWLEKVRGHSTRWTRLDASSALDLKRLLLERDEQIKRAQAEAALRESELQFRATFEQAAVGVAHVALEGQWVRVNHKLCDILGYSRDELRRMTFQDITYPEDLPGDLDRLNKLVRGEIDTYNMEKRYIRKDGTWVWANLTVSLIRDRNRNPRHFIAIVEDIAKRKSAEERNRYLANHDTLTGLPNRAFFSDRLHEAIAHAKRDDGQFALMLLDLDRFKLVNDSLGHHVGDLLLKEVASRLQAAVRETDVVSRLGGDEFAVIQSHVTSSHSPAKLAEKIVEELQRPYWLDGTVIHSGTSIGITLYPGDADDPVSLFKHADLALYRAKDSGRQTFGFFTEDLYNEVKDRKTLEEGLRQALQHGALQLSYQPVFDLTSNRPVGAEALLRLEDADMQLIPASRFMALAEETGLIVPLGEWAVAAAFRQAKEWQTQGFEGFVLGVNLSLKQLKQPGFVDFVSKALLSTGVDPAGIEIDVTEGEIIQHQDEVLSVLHELKGLGLRICADDFGAGLSGLGQLARLPVDAIKIDQSIVQGLPHNRHDSAIAAAIVNLALELDLQVIAEGIETFEQLAFLQSKGCHGGQGFLFSYAISASKMKELLSRHDSTSA